MQMVCVCVYMNDLTSIKSAHPHTLNIIPEPVLKKKKKEKQP